jgi:hypothetical protein
MTTITTPEQSPAPTRRGKKAPPPPSWEIVTPEIAAQWLEANLAEDHNRPLRANRAEGFARDMLAGEWHENGESIKFDTAGRLIDGQHRLAAIVKAGLPVPLLVVRDVAPEAMQTIDMGVARKYSDYLKMEGVRDPAAMAAMERRLYLWNKHGIKLSRGVKDKNPTIKELQNYRPNYGQLLSYALDRAKDVRKRLPKVSAATLGTAYVLFAAIDVEAADTFFDRLMTGASLEHRHPILTLRERLLDTSNQFAQRRTTEDEKLALIVRGWNLWRDGSMTAQIYITIGNKPLTDETFPEPK